MPASAQAVLASMEYESDLDEYEDADESQTQTFQSCQSRTTPQNEPDTGSVANLSDVQTESQRADAGKVIGYRRPTEVQLLGFSKFNELTQYVAKIGRNLVVLSQFTDKAEVSTRSGKRPTKS